MQGYHGDTYGSCILWLCDAACCVQPRREYYARASFGVNIMRLHSLSFEGATRFRTCLFAARRMSLRLWRVTRGRMHMSADVCVEVSVVSLTTGAGLMMSQPRHNSSGVPMEASFSDCWISCSGVLWMLSLQGMCV